MSPVSIVPETVPPATVRRLAGPAEPARPVQQVAVRPVPAPHVVPRQIDPVGLRLMALETEVEFLRAELGLQRRG